jgi:hypothetical protein
MTESAPQVPVITDQAIEDFKRELAQEDELELIDQSRRIVTLQAEIEEREAEISEIKTRILAAHEPGSYTAGKLTVQVREGAARLDARKFTEAFPAAQYPTYYKIQPNTTEIRKAISENDLAQYQVQGKPSVVIK